MRIANSATLFDQNQRQAALARRRHYRLGAVVDD